MVTMADVRPFADNACEGVSCIRVVGCCGADEEEDDDEARSAAVPTLPSLASRLKGKSLGPSAAALDTPAAVELREGEAGGGAGGVSPAPKTNGLPGL